MFAVMDMFAVSNCIVCDVTQAGLLQLAEAFFVIRQAINKHGQC